MESEVTARSLRQRRRYNFKSLGNRPCDKALSCVVLNIHSFRYTFYYHPYMKDFPSAYLKADVRRMFLIRTKHYRSGMRAVPTLRKLYKRIICKNPRPVMRQQERTGAIKLFDYTSDPRLSK